MLLTQLKERKDFTKSEREIIQYILLDPKAVTDMTVDELAANTYSSASSIIRLCQKIGYKGFAEFKIKLATEISTFLIHQERVMVDLPIQADNTTREIAENFLNLHYQALQDVMNTIDFKQLEKAADLLHRTSLVTLLGSGESLVILADFQYKAGKIGLNVLCNPLAGFNHFRTAHLENECVLIVSHYANTLRVRNWISEIKQLQVPIILLYGNRNSPLASLADIPILIDNEESKLTKMGSFASRTAFQYTLDIIYSLLFLKDYNTNIERLYDFQKRSEKQNRGNLTDNIQ